MDEIKQYKTASAFRAALEAQLHTRALDEKTDLQRLRCQVAFDRLLARLFSNGPNSTEEFDLRTKLGGNGNSPELAPHNATELYALKLQDLYAAGSGRGNAREYGSYRRGKKVRKGINYAERPGPISPTNGLDLPSHSGRG